MLFCQRALTQKQTLLGRAAHLSSLSTPFSLMQLAMMMVDATPSPFLERSIFLVGFVPLSSSIGSAWPSTLPRKRRLECQRALTQKQTLWGRVAHFSEVTALSLSASHSLVMPSVV